MRKLMMVAAALALMAWAPAQQWFEGDVFCGRSRGNLFNIKPSGVALVERNGLGWRGRLTSEDPWYPYNAIAVWPEAGGWRCEWRHWQFLSFGMATGWATITPRQDGGMDWVLDLTSDYFGFVERFFVRFVAR